MTTQTYRLKIARVNSLKLKVQSKFPAAVRTGNFLTVTSENGVYTFSVDYSVLTPGPIADPSTSYVAVQDLTAGVYKTVTLASLLTSGLDADLQAIAALTGAGVLVRTADDTWAIRTITGTANEITVTNGAGTAGNPTLSLPAALTFTGKTVTGGTFNGATINGANNTLTVREADLSTSDVTTANVSTTKHGFAPKLPNDATKYLDGTGAYTVPAGSGGSSTDTLFATVADVEAATIPGSVDAIQTAGYSTAGDDGGSIATNAVYARIGSEPSHEGKIQSGDGAWWELTGDLVNIKQFGAVPTTVDPDTDPDQAPAINNCIAYCNSRGCNFDIPAGSYGLDSALTTLTAFLRIRGVQGSGGQSALYKRYTEADAQKGILSLGAYGAEISDLFFWAKSGVSGGSAISAKLPNNAPNIGILRLHNIYSSCGNGVKQNLLINGVANQGGVGGTGGKSYRSVFIENCHFFGAADYCVWFSGVQHCFANNIFMASDGGSIGSGILFYCAGDSVAVNSDIFWQGMISGALYLSQCYNSNFQCIVTGAITNDATVDGVTVLDARSTVGTTWTNSHVAVSPTWTVSTPTATASSGTFTSTTTTVRYRKVGKTASFVAKVVITNAGTAAGNINVTLPFTVAADSAGGGKEIAAVGLQCNWQVSGSTSTLVIAKYDNTTIIASGRTVVVSGTVETS